MVGDDRPRTAAERAYAEALACQDMLTRVPPPPSLWRRMWARLALAARTVMHRSTLRTPDIAPPFAPVLPDQGTADAGEGERR